MIALFTQQREQQLAAAGPGQSLAPPVIPASIGQSLAVAPPPGAGAVPGSPAKNFPPLNPGAPGYGPGMASSIASQLQSTYDLCVKPVSVYEKSCILALKTMAF